VSHFIIRLRFVFAPSLTDSIIFLTLTRLVVVFIFENFSFALFTPSRRLSGQLLSWIIFSNIRSMYRSQMTDILDFGYPDIFLDITF
jgi:hypothetical protein